MERHASDVDPHRLDVLEEPRREVETRGRGRDRSRLAGVNGLVTLSVEWFVIALEIGGKGNMAHPVENLSGAPRGFEANDASPVGKPFLHDHGQLVGDHECPPRLELGPGADECLPAPRVHVVFSIDRPEQQDLAEGPGRLRAQKAEREDAAFVQDEEIAGRKKRGEVGEAKVSRFRALG